VDSGREEMLAGSPSPDVNEAEMDPTERRGQKMATHIPNSGHSLTITALIIGR
jgi:hypothetical protein